MAVKPRKRVGQPAPEPKSFGFVAHSGAATSTGKERDHNEDAYYMGRRLFLVCDGLGGHDAGEIASGMAIQVISEAEMQMQTQADFAAKINEVSQMILAAPENDLGQDGMGTTLTGALLLGSKILLAQIGDSRAYLMRSGVFKQLTTDHTLMHEWISEGSITLDEAKVHPNRSMITRALGTKPVLPPDYFEVQIKAGDRLLLCSDGLYGMVEDRFMSQTLQKAKTPQEAATKLISLANAAGGNDNITAIVVEFVK